MMREVQQSFRESAIAPFRTFDYYKGLYQKSLFINLILSSVEGDLDFTRFCLCFDLAKHDKAVLLRQPLKQSYIAFCDNRC